MQGYYSKKSIIIYDPFSSNGFYLAQSLIPKGYKILLFCDKSDAHLVDNDLFTNRDSSLLTIDINNSCADNFLVDQIFQEAEKIVIINSLKSPKLIFDIDSDFKSELQYVAWGNSLKSFAKDNAIAVWDYGVWQCAPDVLEAIVDQIYAFFTNADKRLYVNSLDLQLYLRPNKEYVADITQMINRNSESASFEKLDLLDVDLRDIIRILVEYLGAEIEFCGKGVHELGVIVDYDEDVLAGRRNINTSKIRLGNTLIKIKESNYNLLSPVFERESRCRKEINTQFGILEEIQKIIKTQLK